MQKNNLLFFDKKHAQTTPNITSKTIHQQLKNYHSYNLPRSKPLYINNLSLFCIRNSLLRMNLRLTFLLILFTSVCVNNLHAQWDAQLSQYWRVKTFFNPAFAGETSNMESALLHRRQWVGFENAPVSSMMLINMPLNFLGKTHGVGGSVINEKIGLFSNTTMSGQYSYKLNFGKGKTLNFGLQLSFANISFDASGIHIPRDDKNIFDPNDPAIPTGGGSGKTLDSGLGVSWVTPKYYVGLSSLHLWEPTFELDDTHSSFIGRTYYLVAGYNIQLSNPLISLQPSTLIKADAAVYQVDLTGRVVYNKMFSGGITWRKDDGFVFLLGANIKNFDVGYSYDLSTSAIGKVSNGSHEICVKYSIPFGKKKAPGGFKSVRIL